MSIPTIKREINTLKFLPPVSRDSDEIREVQRVATIELQALHDAICDIYMNQWLESMGDYGLSQWEKIFDVIPHEYESIFDRKKRIYRLIKGERPYTIRSFQRLLDNIWGADKVTAKVVHDKYELWLNVNSNLNYDLDNIYNFTDEIVPKNLAIMLRNHHEGKCSYTLGAFFKLKKVECITCNSIVLGGMKGTNSMGGIVHMHHNILNIKERG